MDLSIIGIKNGQWPETIGMEEDCIRSQSPQWAVALEKNNNKQKSKTNTNLADVIAVWLITNHSDMSKRFCCTGSFCFNHGSALYVLTSRQMAHVTYV